MKTPVIISTIVILLVLAGGAWYAYTNPYISGELGLRHAAPTAASGTNMSSTTLAHNGYRAGMQGGFVSGSIEILNGTGFTITLSNGDTKNINILATTTIQNYATASSTPTMLTPDQLSVGEQVTVIGTPNADGSIDARFVRTGATPSFIPGNRPYGAGPGHIRTQSQ